MKRTESAYPSAIGRNPLGGHFAAGFAVVLLWYFASVAQASTGPDFSELFGDSDFIEIIERDEGLETRPTGYVHPDAEPDHVFRIDLDEGQVPIGQGVVYDGFLIDGKLPGPTLRVTEGDIVRMEITNSGDVMHGASIHAAYTQTSKHVGHILPGQTRSVTFRATTPGVFMYHCAPGGTPSRCT